MAGKALMFQGTGSDVGKSLLVAGLCRLAKRRGISVAPFKPQNMSNNAAACAGGGEIGRAQALQALAAGLEPHTDFNPVLLKPETDRSSQVIVQGYPAARLEAADYMTRRQGLLEAVMDSFERLTASYDLVVVEGAGSASEVNLRENDIANMGFARRAGVPVCLIGDIDRGGVIASIVGTRTVIEEADARMITGFLINKFRGDPELFRDGIKVITQHTGWRSFGIVPWLSAASRLPQEDAVQLHHQPDQRRSGKIRIVAPMLSRIANFDDADPLRQEPDVDFSFIPPGRPLPRDADIVILFGTKSTLGDLAFLRNQGWDHDILAHARTGGRVLGVCGGFQMLGTKISDPDGVDGVAGEVSGLGLLDIETVMTGDKTVRPVKGRSALWETAVNGYEIHNGRTTGADLARPMLLLDDGPEGARSGDGRIEGSYVHGLFAEDGFRRAWLGQGAGERDGSGLAYSAAVDAALDRVADDLEMALDVEALLGSARPPGWQGKSA